MKLAENEERNNNQRKDKVEIERNLMQYKIKSEQ